MSFFSKSDVKDQWKDKYFNLLEVQKKAEISRKNLEDLLAKTIIKLTFAIAGFDSHLDPHLQRIRNSLKNGIDSNALKTELENFSSELMRLNTQPQQQPLEANLLFDFLFRQHNTAEQKNALQQAQGKYKENKFASTNELFYAIVEAIDSEHGANPPVKPAVSAATSGVVQIDADIVTRQLLYLFESIEIPAIFENQAQAVKQLLGSNQALSAYEQVLDKAVDLLLKIKQHIQSEQQDIDKFLAHITEQLTELGLTVIGASTAAEESALSRMKLDQSVSEQMKALQISSSNATKLEPLKEIINQRLEIISKEIQGHNLEEAEQRHKTQQQLDELTLKVKTMESESNDLKLRLKIANTKALRDSLTGLPNRLAYEERLQTELARWKRYHSPLSLVVWDIDHFKSINDRFGHKAGDKALTVIAKQLSANCRATDFISRFGGEEFIMLLPDTSKEPALKLANHLRTIIEKTGFNSNGISIAITISCGITEIIQNDSHETAFDRADRALYQAKQHGRNQCCCM